MPKIDHVVQIDPKLAAKTARFSARGTVLKWRFRVLKHMQYLTWQSNENSVIKTPGANTQKHLIKPIHILVRLDTS